MMQAAPILECRNLCVSYATRRGEIPAVVNFNLTLRQGEAHGLVGESGCGKSTIALAIMRYLGSAGRVVSGEILFQGRNVLQMDARELRALRGAAIAMIYQEPMASLNPSMTIAAQLMEVPLYHDSVDRAEARRRAKLMLERVRLPDIERMMSSYPHQLSGGQQQRIVIAMALLSNPKVLLLDEPTTALDVTVEAGIIDLIRDIAAEFGTALLFISHNLGLVRETCNRITVMYCGQPVETGPVETVFRRMRHPYTQGLFSAIPTLDTDKTSARLTAIPGQIPAPGARPSGCVFGPRCHSFVQGACDTRAVELRAVDGDTDHHSRCARLDEINWSATRPSTPALPRSQNTDTILEVSDLSKRYGHVDANDRLTFTVRRGEMLAIVGESGCGKSTFARVLMGLTSASSGSLEFEHRDLGRIPVTRRAPAVIRSLQMIFQNPFDTLNPSQSVGAQISRVIRKFGVEKDESKVRARMLALLDLVKLPREFAEHRPRQLSGGQKQRVGVARAFAANPAIIVADEPVSALDVSVQAAVTDLLIDVQRQEGTTLLFISHDLSVVRYLADRILVMYLGRVMEEGTAQEVFAPPYHPYTEALLAAVPLADKRYVKRKVLLTGDLPSASNPPRGCRFSSRCGQRIAGVCETVPPPVQEFSTTHRLACHLSRAQLLAMRPVFQTADPASPGESIEPSLA